MPKMNDLEKEGVGNMGIWRGLRTIGQNVPPALDFIHLRFG